MLQMHMTLNLSAVNDVGLKMQCTSEDKGPFLDSAAYCFTLLPTVSGASTFHAVWLVSTMHLWRAVIHAQGRHCGPSCTGLGQATWG